MRILVTEDEKKIASFIERGLKESGYAVDVVHTGEDCIEFVKNHDYDLIILDLMLPGKDGYGVLEILRGDELFNGPVLMLTALSSVKNKVQGLDKGADDYLTKPFEFDELLARVRALFRRGTTPSTEGTILQHKDLTLDLVAREVKQGENKLSLTPKEFSILEYLLRNKNRIVTRTQLLEHVWNMNFDPDSNVTDVYINILRKKLKAITENKIIKTVVGVGYTLDA